ncbi:Competence protein A [Novipirellula aureliae]|uniref:Competence protein A n=1 Tax=Novipirellula aureliae TaxID=2527966 RepID=A0A5C6E3X2_9BACT|nr:hypothetical protein [Novipirellula aureliae]TWU43184.1 Competence protein A [Novipirellula aureliae]
MPKKIAIDWDESELRVVAANSNGSKVSIIGADVVPLNDSDVYSCLRHYVSEHGFDKAETVVVIGRGKAELRELQLPPVPDEELPDMVRFQSIRNFASAGDNATIDYLITSRNESGVKAIAAAVSPKQLTEVTEVCQAAALEPSQIVLRPLAAAALFLQTDKPNQTSGDTVLIDLLNDDAEITLIRDGGVIFVRTVRMPASQTAQAKSLVNELRRSLLACGATQSLSRIVLWGRESVHREQIEHIATSMEVDVQVVNPFDLVDIEAPTKSKLPDHIGRLAPLVGLLVCDGAHTSQLIDFLNPRRREEVKPNHRRTAILIGIPVAILAGSLFWAYQNLRSLDSQIERLTTITTETKEPVTEALEKIAKVRRIDQFLDSQPVWLDELRQIAVRLPPSDKVMLKSVTAASDPRTGVGTLTLAGSAIDPSVIEKLEEAIRDDDHRVIGEGASEQNSKDAYRWVFTEKVTIEPDYSRNKRYEGIKKASQTETSDKTEQKPEASNNKSASGQTQPKLEVQS